MISYLIGKPIPEKDGLTLLVHGVGYGVKVCEKVKLSSIALSELELFIYTHVREEVLELYGFTTKQDREIFLLLIDVSGVGPKTALSILNTGVSEVIHAVQHADTSFFSSIPRIGKKLAQKIIIDLRTKLGELKELDLAPLSAQRQEVTLALQSLGFDEAAIHQALQVVDIENITTAEAVTQSIRHISQKS